MEASVLPSGNLVEVLNIYGQFCHIHSKVVYATARARARTIQNSCCYQKQGIKLETTWDMLWHYCTSLALKGCQHNFYLLWKVIQEYAINTIGIHMQNKKPVLFSMSTDVLMYMFRRLYKYQFANMHSVHMKNNFEHILGTSP